MQDIDQEIRIIAVNGAPKIIGKMFRGLTVNGNGTVRVGDIDLEEHEIPGAVAMAASLINDAVSDLERTDSRRELLANEIYNAEDFLPIRQEVLRTAVIGIRNDHASRLL